MKGLAYDKGVEKVECVMALALSQAETMPPQHVLQHVLQHVPQQQFVQQHTQQGQNVGVERDENAGTDMGCGEYNEGSRSWSTLASDGMMMSRNAMSGNG